MVALVRRAQRGDDEAFSRLVVLTTPRAAATARLVLGSLAAADDALQDAYLRAWHQLPGLRDPERFESWLRRIVVTTCLNHRRATHRLERALGRFAHEQADQGHGPDADPAGGESLDSALSTLTREQRALLTLRFGEELNSQEIAATLGIPAGTVRSRLHAVVVRLRAVLAADTDQNGPKTAPETT
ncbi:MAG: RNA polymerase sigma factor [Chloroflexota bacterium]|nr:RNA polymerase sigma factor [Chloroflexota bacterium]